MPVKAMLRVLEFMVRLRIRQGRNIWLSLVTLGVIF